jgi:hypothetical protein
MSALQLKYFGKRRKRSSGRLASNPKRSHAVAKKKRHHRRKRSGLHLFSNPRRRRLRANPRRHHRRHHYRKNPIMRRRFRRNPMPGSIGGFIGNSLVPAAVGAAGAIGVDMLIGNLPLPYNLTSGRALPLVRIGAALLVGAGVAAVAGDEAGGQAAAGGMIVAVYGLAKSYLQNAAPNIRMARYVRMSRYVRMKGAGRIKGIGTPGRARRKRAPVMHGRRPGWLGAGMHGAPKRMGWLPHKKPGQRMGAVPLAPTLKRIALKGYANPARTIRLSRYVGGGQGGLTPNLRRFQ